MQKSTPMLRFFDNGYGEKALFCAVCSVFFILPFNRGIYLTLYTAGLIGLVGLISFWRAGRFGTLPFVVWLPLLFCLYVVVTPGCFFKDMPLGETMFLSYVTGLAIAVFLAEKLWYACVCSLVGLCFSLIWFVLRGFPQDMMWNGRLRLFFNHPSVLSFIAGILFVYFLGVLREQTPTRKKIAIVGCIIGFGIIVFCAARGTYLALAVSGAFLAFATYQRYWLRIVLFFIIGGVILFGALSETNRDRLLSAIRHPSHDATFVSRQPIWDAAVVGFEEAPFWGNGFRTFQKFHGRFITEHAQELAEKYPVIESEIASPHNVYLGFIFGYGIAGTVLLLCSLIPAVMASFAVRQYLFPAILLFYASYGLFDYPLHRKDGILMLFLPLGLVYGRRLAAALQGQTPADRQQTDGGEAEQDFRPA